MGVTQIKEWFNRFKNGRTSVESDKRSGRPQTARIAVVVERVKNLVMGDRRLTVREIAEEVTEVRGHAPEGQTVTKEYHQQVFDQLRDAVRRKRPDLWTAKNWLLHHDNAPVHSSHLIQNFLAKHGIPVVRHPPYSPDMAPCDFWLFPKLKTPLKGSRLRVEKRQCRTRRWRCTPFQKKPSRSVFGSGSIGGLSVCRRKGPTLKGIRVIFLDRPRTFRNLPFL